MMGVRREPRYVPVGDAQRFSLKFGKQQFSLEDISAGGARLKQRDQALPAETKCQLVGPDTSVVLNIVASDPMRFVVQFDDQSRIRLQKHLPSLVQNNVLTNDQNKVLQDRALNASEIRAICTKLAKCDGLPAQAPDIIKDWISLNQQHVAKLGSDAWPLVCETLEKTFQDYYLHEDRFTRYLGDVLSGIRDEGFETVHAVPMRMLQGLSKFLGQHQRVFEHRGIEWKPSLWNFLNELKELKNQGEPAHKSCLVAVDTFLSEGVSRRQFLKLMATIGPEALARHYSDIRLVAVVGHDEGQAWEEVALPLKSAGIKVAPRVGWSLPTGARSQAWQSFLCSIDRPVTERLPTLVVFYYGAPTEAVPLYWQRSDDWHPLFRPFEYYNPSHRPIPRAPFFSAYPKTLKTLHSRVQEGGAALLYGPQGCGKTYLTARLAEVCRSSCYIFWYQCRPFDAVENIIEHLDVFLKMFDIGDLSSSLYKPLGEADIAEQLVNSLRKLDHPAVLIFDGLENLGISEVTDDDLVSMPFLLFVKHLIAALNQKSDSLVSQPFLLLTHTEISVQDPAVRDMAKALGLNEKTQMVLCPAEREDAFTHALPLARKLIRNPKALEEYAELVHCLSLSDPYKTWLLCYWINRCLRRGGGGLTDEIKSEIEEVLDSRRAVFLSNVSTLHEVIYEKLSERESEILKTAAAWTLPWSIDDLDKTLNANGNRSRPEFTEETKKIVHDLLSDRAPFLVRLGQSVHDELLQPFAPQFGGEIREQERFEMPSIAAAFFKERLEKDPGRPEIYGRMAQQLDQRLEEINDGRSVDEVECKVLKKTLSVERILSLCSANKPSEATKAFTDTEEYRELRKLNSWERVLQLGRAILAAADRSDDSGFTIEVRCETSVVHANALTEAFRFREAQEVCNRALEFVVEASYWGCRLRLVLAKCLRFENKYEKALEQQKKVRGQLEALLRQSESSESGQDGSAKQDREIAVWLGRTLTATAQCLMALGQLREAQAVLISINGFLSQMDEANRRIVEGLQLRHHGTIQLLYGNLDDAKALFGQLAQQTRTQRNKRVHTIALYKQARALLEKVRTYEAPLQWVSGINKEKETMRTLVTREVPNLSEVKGWLEQAKKYISEARQGLAKLAQGDRKWFPAVDLWHADAQLLELRFGAGIPPGEARQTLAKIQHLVDRVKRRLPALGTETPEARTLEIQTLLNSIEYQFQIMEGKNMADEGLVRSLMNRYEKPEMERNWWDSKVSNPYKHSRSHYECMYYLWRTIAGYTAAEPLPIRGRMLEAAAQAYRSGTTLLYAHGMSMSAHPLHRLALACFADHSLGLQELLEATICLFPDSSEPVEMVLNRIALESVDSVRRPENIDEDRFFTIPTKVICRLLGDHELYSEIVGKRNQPSQIPQGEHGSELLVKLARKLSLQCYRWTTTKNSGYWEEIARKKNLPGGQADRFKDWAEHKVEALGSWLDTFLTAPPGSNAEVENKIPAKPS